MYKFVLILRLLLEISPSHVKEKEEVEGGGVEEGGGQTAGQTAGLTPLGGPGGTDPGKAKDQGQRVSE